MINPNDFVITRKRKKYKFAKFANAPNCFEFDEWKQNGVPAQTYSKIVLEIGAGTGLFSVELARRNPDTLFVAIDVKADRLQKGAYAAQEASVDNVYFIRARADQLPELFLAQTVNAVWVTFPDPFPKKRSAGRRLTHPTFLRMYKQLLVPRGELLMKHDNLDFFQWSLEQLAANGWHIRQLSFNLHESDLPAHYKLHTTYEQRWLGEGRIIYFVGSHQEG